MIVVNTVTEEAFRQVRGTTYVGIKSGKMVEFNTIDGILIKMALDDMSIVDPKASILYCNDTIYEAQVRYEFDRMVEVQKFNSDGELDFEFYYGLKPVVLVPKEYTASAIENTFSRVNPAINTHYKVNDRGDVFKFNSGSRRLAMVEDNIVLIS